MKKKQEGLSDQHKDTLTALIISAVVHLGFWFWFVKSFLTEVMGWKISTQLIVMLISWMCMSGGLIGIFAQQKAHQRIAYGKK